MGEQDSQRSHSCREVEVVVILFIFDLSIRMVVVIVGETAVQSGGTCQPNDDQINKSNSANPYEPIIYLDWEWVLF